MSQRLCQIPVATSITHAERGRIGYLTEERAHDLVLRVAHTPGYSVLEVRRAWSAMHAWQVTIEDRRTGEHILLLDDNQFDARLTSEAEEPTEPTEDGKGCAAATSNS